MDVSALRARGDFDTARLHRTRSVKSTDAMAAELWLPWISDERRCGGSNSNDFVALLIAAATASCPRAPVWHAALDNLTRVGAVPSAVRTVIHDAIASPAAHDTQDGHALWVRILEWEEEQLAAARDALRKWRNRGSSSAMADDDNDDSDSSASDSTQGEDDDPKQPEVVAVVDAIRRLRELYRRRLALPLPDSDATMKAYIAFEGRESERSGAAAAPSSQAAIDDLAARFAAAHATREARDPLESSIAAARSAAAIATPEIAAVGAAVAAVSLPTAEAVSDVSHDALANAWVRYIDSEVARLSAAPAPRGGRTTALDSAAVLVPLLGRAVLDAPRCVTLWQRLVEYTRKDVGSMDGIVTLRVARCAVRACPADSDLWRMYFDAVERAHGSAAMRCWRLRRGIADPVAAAAAVAALVDPVEVLCRAVDSSGARSDWSHSATGHARQQDDIATHEDAAWMLLLVATAELRRAVNECLAAVALPQASDYVTVLLAACSCARRLAAEAKSFITEDGGASGVGQEAAIGPTLPPTSIGPSLLTGVSESTARAPQSGVGEVASQVRRVWARAAAVLAELYPTWPDALVSVLSFIGWAESETMQDTKRSDAAWSAALRLRGVEDTGTKHRGAPTAAAAAAAVIASAEPPQRIATDAGGRIPNAGALVAAYADAIACSRAAQRYARCRSLFSELLHRLHRGSTPTTGRGQAKQSHLSPEDATSSPLVFSASVCDAWESFEAAVGSRDDVDAAHAACLARRQDAIARLRTLADVAAPAMATGTQASGATDAAPLRDSSRNQVIRSLKAIAERDEHATHPAMPRRNKRQRGDAFGDGGDESRARVAAASAAHAPQAQPVEGFAGATMDAATTLIAPEAANAVDGEAGTRIPRIDTESAAPHGEPSSTSGTDLPGDDVLEVFNSADVERSPEPAPTSTAMLGAAATMAMLMGNSAGAANKAPTRAQGVKPTTERALGAPKWALAAGRGGGGSRFGGRGDGRRRPDAQSRGRRSRLDLSDAGTGWHDQISSNNHDAMTETAAGTLMSNPTSPKRGTAGAPGRAVSTADPVDGDVAQPNASTPQVGAAASKAFEGQGRSLSMFKPRAIARTTARLGKPT